MSYLSKQSRRANAASRPGNSPAVAPALIPGRDRRHPKYRFAKPLLSKAFAGPICRLTIAVNRRPLAAFQPNSSFDFRSRVRPNTNDRRRETMPDLGLQPGERVVELAAVVRTAAIVSGAVAGVATTWLVRRSWWFSLAAFVLGAVAGFVVSQFVSRLYRSADGQTVVARVGSTSLPATIPAGLAGGVSVALVVGIAVILLLSAQSRAVPVLGTSLGCGIVLGIIFACLASLV